MPDWFLSSTSYVTEHIFSPAFGVPADRCLTVGYPRDDHLVRGSQPPPELVTHPASWDELRSADRVVGVFLTWRDGRADDAVDLELLGRLAELAREHGARIAYKAHYNVAPAARLPDNCTLIPTEVDLHAYLGLCDVLVTDYSSISFDFMQTRRPVLYHMPDLDDYVAARGLYFDPDAVPGAVARRSTELLELLETALDQPEKLRKDGDDEFIELIWGGYDGDACEALAERLRRFAADGA